MVSTTRAVWEEGAGMSDEQYRKIGDVIHTLSFIHDGKALNVRSSVMACMTVLNQVLDMELAARKGEPK